MTIKPIVNKKTGNEEQEQNNTQRDKRNIGTYDNRIRRSPSKSIGRSKRDIKRDKNAVVVQTKYQTHSTPTTAAAVGVKKQLPSVSSGSSGVSNTKLLSAKSQASVVQQQNQIISSTISNNNTNSSELVEQCMSSDKEQVSGYNSGDEHLGSKERLLTSDEWKTRDDKFASTLNEQGLIIKEMEEDGACLFRAISFQLYGDQDQHELIRQQTMDYIFQNREYFAQFITEDITKYCTRKRQNHLHGNHIEIQAMSEMYNRPVELYCYELTPINIYNSEQMNNGYQPLRLSYHRYSHYNAILDPYKSSVGVGLGLAGYRPEDFDPAKQMKDAVLQSEQLEIEKMMVEDKLKMSDWEATSDQVVEQIARQSYLQFCKENMNKTLKKNSCNKSSTSTITSSTEPAGGCSSSSSCGDTSSQQQSSSTKNSEKDPDNSNLYSVEYFMHQQQGISRRKKRHHNQGIEKRKQDETVSKEQSTSVTIQKRSKRTSPSPPPSTSSSSPVLGTSEAEKNAAMSAFYQSLLESSYAVDGVCQMSEREMLQKALTVSAMDYMKTETSSGSKQNEDSDDAYDSP
ncbi:unnamed protein product [Diamesa serratosioi]